MEYFRRWRCIIRRCITFLTVAGNTWTTRNKRNEEIKPIFVFRNLKYKCNREFQQPKISDKNNTVLRPTFLSYCCKISSVGKLTKLRFGESRIRNPVGVSDISRLALEPKQILFNGHWWVPPHPGCGSTGTCCRTFTSTVPRLRVDGNMPLLYLYICSYWRYEKLVVSSTICRSKHLTCRLLDLRFCQKCFEKSRFKRVINPGPSNSQLVAILIER